MANTVRVKGYREFVRACDRAGKETKREVRGTFRKVGDIVKVDARGKFDVYDPKSAKRFRTVVRQRGVTVEQSLRKSLVESRRRPAFGDLQLRKALEPALEENETRVVSEMENAVDRVADHFDRG